MTGRQTWLGWPHDGYPWHNGESSFEQTQPLYGQSYGQGALFNHSSNQESRDEMLNQPWGFQTQMNFQNPYMPATPTHSSQPHLHQNEYYAPYQEYQQPQISFEDKWLDKLDLFEKRFLEMSNSLMKDMDKVHTIIQDSNIQPCRDEASHCDEGLRVFEEVKIEESLCDGGFTVFEQFGGEESRDDENSWCQLENQEVRLEESHGDEEEELEEKEDPNFELEENLFDGECGSNRESGSEFCENTGVVECELKGDSMVDFCKVSSDVECESCDDSLVEPFDESSATKTKEFVKEIINIFEKLWVENEDESNHDSKIESGEILSATNPSFDLEDFWNNVECESNHDSKSESCDESSDTNLSLEIKESCVKDENESNHDSMVETYDESSTLNHEPTSPNFRHPIFCQTIHYTNLEISGVMYIDLPTNQEGVNLGIELPLSTKSDLKLLSKPGRPVISICKTKDRQHGPNLLPPSELLQGFVHVYDPFERG